MIHRAYGFAILLLLVAAPAFAQAPPKSTCTDCHSALDAPLKVTDDDYAADIHAQKGLTCAACHGGDVTASDDTAMSKAKGFKGHIDRAKIPELCASCHSNPTYMKTYNPSLRTDQLAEYKTSVHGRKLAAGDTNVAVCTDCHGVHPIRPPSDTNSRVHPLNIATTCSRCHSDHEKMKAYGIKTDQFAGYSVSVHAEAMTVRGDLSAPTCTTCHGNHGATPPGVGNVENICSNCHVFQAQLYDKSPHKAAYQTMGGPNCITCHNNHRIVHPTDAMIGTDSKAVCTTCHVEGDPGFKFAGETHLRLAKLESSIADSDALLSEAEHSGIEVSQPKLDENEARDALTKSRVSIHSFDPKMWGEIDAGMKVAAKTHAAGVDALRERHYRRLGLVVSLVTILLMLIGLGLYIRAIESDGTGIQQGSSH